MHLTRAAQKLMSSSEELPLPPDSRLIGLCLDCKHMRRIVSERGSIFYMCSRALTEPEFPKYPRLPVNACDGYAKLKVGPK
jgi:hypothetical protein